MEPLPPDHAEPEMDALLRTARPRPDAAWRSATERRLLDGRRGWRTVLRPRPVVRLGAAAAVALAAFVLALSLAGVGPLADEGRTVEAKDRCRTVAVTRTERVPSIEHRNGQDVVRYHREQVQRFERRCE